MQPTIEIVRTQNGRFSFAVEAGDGEGWYIRDGLISIQACVQKAAAALGREFKFANIAYNVMPVEDDRAVKAARVPPPRALLNPTDLAAKRYW